MEISAVPEPTTWALIIFAVMLGVGSAIRRWRAWAKGKSSEPIL